MKVKDKFKKIASLFFLVFICLVMSSCCNVTMDINKDGSGQATILIAKEYQDETGNNVIITREDVDKKLNDIILAANVCSGEEDRVKIKKVKKIDLNDERANWDPTDPVAGNPWKDGKETDESEEYMEYPSETTYNKNNLETTSKNNSETTSKVKDKSVSKTTSKKDLETTTK